MAIFGSQRQDAAGSARLLRAERLPSLQFRIPSVFYWQSRRDRTAICGRRNVVTEFSIPEPFGEPLGIAKGPDGNLWFTDGVNNNVGRITTGGVVTVFPIPSMAAGPAQITSSPDGTLWFTEEFSHKIARITTSGVMCAHCGGAFASFPRSWFARVVASQDVVRCERQWIRTKRLPGTLPSSSRGLHPYPPLPGRICDDHRCDSGRQRRISALRAAVAAPSRLRHPRHEISCGKLGVCLGPTKRFGLTSPREEPV
jgi:hypothetical protein